MEKMSPEEAKKNLVAYMYLHFEDLPAQVGNAISIACEALSKQTAESPLKVPEDDDGLYYHYECPCCNRILSDRFHAHHCICGQTLLWP